MIQSRFQTDESAFNFAAEYLKSVKRSLDMAKYYAVRQDVDNWYRWIRAAFREIALLTNSTEDNDFEKDFKEINILINDPRSRKTKRKTILSKLDKLEIKLRKKIQEKGMGLPRKSDPRFAVLQR